MRKEDRRTFTRFAVDFPVEIKHQVAKMTTQARAYDASAIGVGIFSEERLVPNISLGLSLNIPDGHVPLERLARVTWSKQVSANKWRSGLEFSQVDLMGLRRVLEKPKKKS